MNAKEFFDLVANMREEQKNFFKDRSSYYLNRAKYLERQVDAEIERVRKIESGEQFLFEQ